jgi:hypothetical protein
MARTVTLEADDPRWGRALFVLAGCDRWERWSDGWRMPGAGAVHFVTSAACSCPAAQYARGLCKHMLACRLYACGLRVALPAKPRQRQARARP